MDWQGCIPSGGFRESFIALSFAASGCQQFLAHSPASFWPLCLLSHLFLCLPCLFFSHIRTLIMDHSGYSLHYKCLYSHSRISFCHMRQHSHRFQGLKCRQLGGIILPTTTTYSLSPPHAFIFTRGNKTKPWKWFHVCSRTWRPILCLSCTHLLALLRIGETCSLW